MEKLVRITAVAAPLLRINVDTDQIIPARYLVARKAEDTGSVLFANWRYKDGETIEDPDFILNRAPYRQAAILLAERNFGCGSSRETAPVALRAFGFRAVIAPSFGGIFFNNCFRNGIVPVALPSEAVRALAAEVEASGGQKKVTVDLEPLQVVGPAGVAHSFTVPERARQMLLQGLDEIDLTLSDRPEIEAFRARDQTRRPWAYL